MASDDVCADVVASLMPSSLTGFFAELALGSYVELPRPEERDVLKEALALFTASKPTQILPKQKTPVKKPLTTTPAKKATKRSA